MTKKLLSFALMLTLFACISAAHSATIGKTDPATPGNLSALRNTDRYKLARSRYKTVLAKLHREWVAALKANDPTRIMEAERNDEIDRKESWFLTTLREKSETRRIDFEGQCPENKALSISSTASARIFWVLLDENRIPDKSPILNTLEYCDVSKCAKGWTAVLRRIVNDRSKPDWKHAALCLYRLGDTRIEYRRCAEELAAGGDTQALRSILYKGPRSEHMIPLRSKANAALADKFMKPKYSPEIQVLAAEWAADTGQLSKAESVCIRVLWQPSGADLNSID